MSTPVESCPEIKLSMADDDDGDRDKRVKMMQRAQWLRAAILGANDGLLSTTSLMLGVGAAKEDQRLMIIAGLAGALSGACSMAVGEFVSVSTQRDIEVSAIDKCNSRAEVSGKNESDHCVKIQESAPVEGILVISSPGATSSKNPATHIFSPMRSPFMRVVLTNQESRTDDDDMEDVLPNPWKAAGASGLAFLCGSLVPLLSAMVFTQYKTRVVVIVVVTSIALAVFGGAGARLGGSPVRASAVRVLVGGWISMAVTYGLLKPLDRDYKGVEDSD
ncbi:hypothetical protein DH2020_013700 [Rehmannia glutinosa]|uniref:Vacuolar iron transporter n=1 Tax=Rehmannia glutinosa TaxID=99300 RepID=A0ABR0X4C4_REHGL